MALTITYLLARLFSISIVYCAVIALLKHAFDFIIKLYATKLHPIPRSQLSQKFKKAPMGSNQAVLENVEPLLDFEYQCQPPSQFRPFKSKGHVKMGIKKSTKQEWIRIDDKYSDRVAYRKRLLEEFPNVTFSSNEIARPAVEELYNEIMLDLLPKRFPKMFKVERGVFTNLTTGSQHCISEARSDPLTMLRHLGENVEEDFYLMCPNEDGEFILQSFVSCFPQGFVPSSRVRLSVEQIHGPVPGYDQRLKKGVNRCFQRMSRGQSFGRLNWAIQLNDSELFLPFDGANTKGSVSMKPALDPLSSFLRCEHHTLTCLPKTGVVVFTVRSYLYPLSDIKVEGSGPELADACDSMPEKFGIYKNRTTWGATLCDWLRDEAGSMNLPPIITGEPPNSEPCVA